MTTQEIWWTSSAYDRAEFLKKSMDSAMFRDGGPAKEVKLSRWMLAAVPKSCLSAVNALKSRNNFLMKPTPSMTPRVLHKRFPTEGTPFIAAALSK